MDYFIAALIVMALFITFTAFGVIFSNKPLKGSCGGLGKATGEKCGFCGKKPEEACKTQTSVSL